MTCANRALAPERVAPCVTFDNFMWLRLLQHTKQLGVLKFLPDQIAHDRQLDLVPVWSHCPAMRPRRLARPGCSMVAISFHRTGLSVFHATYACSTVGKTIWPGPSTGAGQKFDRKRYSSRNAVIVISKNTFQYAIFKQFVCDVEGHTFTLSTKPVTFEVVIRDITDSDVRIPFFDI